MVVIGRFGKILLILGKELGEQPAFCKIWVP